MRMRSALLTFSIALLVASTALPSFAATPAMEACSAKWADLKKWEDQRSDLAGVLEQVQQRFRRHRAGAT